MHGIPLLRWRFLIPAFYQFIRLSQQRDFDNAGVHGFSQGKVTDNVAEELPVVVLWGGSKIKLKANTGIAFADALGMKGVNCPVPRQVRVMQVMRFVIKYHQTGMAGDSVTECGAGIQCLCPSDRWPEY